MSKAKNHAAHGKIELNRAKRVVAIGGDFCVYLGPTIPGVIQNASIFQGNRSAVLAGLTSVTEKYPLVKQLISGSDTLPQDRIKVKTPGNLLYVLYHRLAAGKR